VRRPPPPGDPVTVVFGRPRFSVGHRWSDVPAAWTGDLSPLAGRVVIEHTGHNQLGARLARGRPPVHVVVPITSPVTEQMFEHGSFGLIQQFGVGTDAIDLGAAARCGVQVASMPGLNAVPVAEHAIALVLALARRLPEAGDGFRSGHWGEPAGQSLAGTTAAVIGFGAVGTQVAHRLTAFGVTVTGVRRRPGPVASAPAAMRPGALLVNVARGGLLDDQAALRAVHAGHLGGLGLDVYPQEPYPADGPLTHHPRVIATAHTAALTDGVFRDAARRLGEALHRWTNGLPPENLVVPLRDRQRCHLSRGKEAVSW
jgi:phosphoglycerate dehydrogenase-like enzyme